MISSETIATASLTFAILSFGWAGFAQYRALRRSEHVQVDVARDELIKVLSEDRDAQKLRFEREREEYVEYRKKAHEMADAAQVRMFALAEENGLLKAKTDVTPLLEHQQQQSVINKQIIESLNLIIAHLNRGNPPH